MILIIRRFYWGCQIRASIKNGRIIATKHRNPRILVINIYHVVFLFFLSCFYNMLPIPLKWVSTCPVYKPQNSSLSGCTPHITNNTARYNCTNNLHHFSLKSLRFESLSLLTDRINYNQI